MPRRFARASQDLDDDIRVSNVLESGLFHLDPVGARNQIHEIVKPVGACGCTRFSPEATLVIVTWASAIAHRICYLPEYRQLTEKGLAPSVVPRGAVDMLGFIKPSPRLS
jgi:hypothetical protein